MSSTSFRDGRHGTSPPRSARDAAAAAAVISDPRWTAVLRRDAAADGSFVFSVRTTGVFCRPSCGARRPRPENVAFHGDATAAARAGFRPCRRCRPTGADPAAARTALVASVCRRLEDAGDEASTDDLARGAAVSPSHLRRVFREATGLSLRDYRDEVRARRVRERLAAGDPVTMSLHAAGYGSPGRFYAAADGVLGMEPSRYRAGGAGMDIRFATGAGSLGVVLVAATERGICAILLGDDAGALEADLATRFPRARRVAAGAEFAERVAAAVALVERPAAVFELPLDIRGTVFQRRVWETLRRVPAGTTLSYGELAAAAGAPGSARAVARACATNPLAVAVPCHRVVGKDGALTGYRWGVQRKRALLDRERSP